MCVICTSAVAGGILCGLFAFGFLPFPSEFDLLFRSNIGTVHVGLPVIKKGKEAKGYDLLPPVCHGNHSSIRRRIGYRD